MHRYKFYKGKHSLQIHSAVFFAMTFRDAVVEEGAPAMGAKGLCIPLKQPVEIKPTDKCICPGCDKKPEHITMFGRSY